MPRPMSVWESKKVPYRPKLVYVLLLGLFTISSVSALATTKVTVEEIVKAQVSEAEGGETWPHGIPQAVKKAIDASQVSDMSHLLGASVELLLPNSSGIYSKKQAEMLIGEFLTSHPQLSYSVDHEECTGSNVLTIGMMRGADGNFRISVLTQKRGETQQIKQLKIEEQK